MMTKLVFLLISVAALLCSTVAFHPRHNAFRPATRLHLSDDSGNQGKGFGKKKVAVKEAEVKQPFNTRLDSTTEAPSKALVQPEDKNLYQTPRARREAELDEKIARLKEEEDLISSDTSVGAVPELVADRMIGRIVAFFGIPVFGGKSI
jgi:hypothetical protein